MKQKTVLSTFSKIITIVIPALIIALFCGIYYRTGNDTYCWLLLGIMCLLCGAALYYSPQSIELSENAVIVNAPVNNKTICLTDISSVGLCSPTMSEKRIFGSGGFGGFWGYFYEPSIGRYFAYYGKSSDCFLITLKNGKKYLIGCENPDRMVTAITERLADLQ